jgi:hypothetical protein
MNPNDMCFVDPCEAFQHAVDTGYLSSVPTGQPCWAGDYMYMHTTPNAHAFKHIGTRRYLYVPLASRANWTPGAPSFAW